MPTGSDIESIDDLAGKKVGVQQGTTGKTYTEENAPDADIVTFPSDAEMYQAIKAGQVDALLQDLPVNLEHTKDGGFKIVQKYSTDEQYGLAIKKGNTALVERRQRAADRRCAATARTTRSTTSTSRPSDVAAGSTTEPRRRS